MTNGNFLSLIAVENIKLWKRFSTKLMVLIMVAIIFGFSGLIKASQSLIKEQSGSGASSGTSVSITAQPDASSDAPASRKADWKQDLKAEDIGSQQAIRAMEKSKLQSEKNGLDSTKKQLAENEYRIDNDLKPEQESGYWDWVSSFGYGIFAALLAIIACSGLVAGEFSDNTMKTMVPRPFARWQILTAKFIAAFAYSLVIMVVGYLSLLAAVAVFLGTGGASAPMLLWVGGGIVKVSGFAGSLITNGLDYLTVLVYLIFAFVLSAIFRSRALATGVSIFLMLGGSFTTLLAQNFDWGKYIFFADTGFSGFVTSGAPFYGITLGLAVTICAVYCVGFLCAGYLTFAKRDIV
jgi:ABC-type transport system involved in multi-copper enzyme maturation, permease component